MSKLSILVIEDEPLARKTLANCLSDHQIDFAADFETAQKKLKEGTHDLCFIDLRLGENDDYSGLRLIPLAAAKQMYNVVMSGNDSEMRRSEAYDLGCNDFYAKGNESNNVTDVLTRYLNWRDKPHLKRLYEDQFVTADRDTRASIADALRYASSEIPIIILGPSGSGKTSLARIIHEHSQRTGEFIAINCSAYTENLLEAELFGYKKGAFTGAAENRKGKLLLADRGTLFLDEIGSMSLNMQTKLLKAIEEKSFYPLGSEEPQSSRFRIVSATLEDLQALIKAGKLRFDFFQRIHGLAVRLKPLAQRKDDLYALIDHFMRDGRRLSFTAEAKAQILRHDWPGNVRELRKFIDLLVAGPDGKIGSEAVLKILRSLALEEGSGFVSEEQFRYAKTEGLNAAMRRFVDTIIQRSMAENGSMKKKVMAELKIANRILYNSLRRAEEPSSGEKR